MYKCSECNKTCLVASFSAIVGSPLAGAKLFYSNGQTCYQACPHCNKIHFYGMEKVNVPRI